MWHVCFISKRIRVPRIMSTLRVRSQDDRCGVSNHQQLHCFVMRYHAKCMPYLYVYFHRHLFGKRLTHWGRDKMDIIYQTTFSNALMYKFRWFIEYIALKLVPNPWSRRTSKKISKLSASGLCEGNPPVTGESVSMWWRLHDRHTNAHPSSIMYRRKCW